MHTYRDLFAERSFRALWSATALTVAAGTAVSLGLATTVYDATGSALLSALALFGPSLVHVVGAATLMSVALSSLAVTAALAPALARAELAARGRTAAT